jgi:ketosteroid isomerase-like protein
MDRSVGLVNFCSLSMALTLLWTGMASAQGAHPMATRETVQAYFQHLRQRGDWTSLLAEDMTFISFTSPNKRVTGKGAYLEATKRFYASIQSVELRDLLVDGDRACALTHYILRGPGGDFESDVAEVFEIHDGQISSFDIYFDTAPFPK